MRNTKQYLGKRIQEIRKQKNLKQSELAELIEIDPKHMSKIECGRCFPSFDLLDRISEKLNVSISRFFEIEHLQKREEIIKEISEKLDSASDTKLQIVYKIVKEIL